VTSVPDRLPAEVDVGVVGEAEETLSDLVSILRETGGCRRTASVASAESFSGTEANWCGRPPGIRSRTWMRCLSQAQPFRHGAVSGADHDPGQPRGAPGHVHGHVPGMPYRCIYCTVPATWGRWRGHSAAYVAREIEFLVREYEVRGIAIVDDLFFSTASGSRISLSSWQGRGPGKVKFLVDGRSNLMTDELFRLLKELNVVQLSLGIESGSQRVLDFMGKGVTVGQNRDALAMAAAMDRRVWPVHAGFPTETREEMDATVAFMRDNPIRTIHLSVVTPMPGTKLWAIGRGGASWTTGWTGGVSTRSSRRLLASPVRERERAVA